MEISDQQISAAKGLDVSHLSSTHKYYVTILSNFARAYDKYNNHYSKTNIPARFPDQFFVLDKMSLNVGIDKSLHLLRKNGNDKDKVIVLETRISEKLYNDHATGIGHYIKKNSICIERCFLLETDSLLEYSIEDIMAQSLALQSFQSYDLLSPRSVSFLPVSKGCQASCSFCFSKASVSSEIKAVKKELVLLEAKLAAAKQKGAQRAVITGGGEPGLLPEAELLTIIKSMNKYFEKIVLITNAYNLNRMDDSRLLSTLKDMQEAGLKVLAISYHHYNSGKNQTIMNLDIDLKRVLKFLHQIKPSITSRLICVLQKGGVETENDIEDYIAFAAENNVKQICFKELYVSTSAESYYHSHSSNVWSRQNQIPLSLLVNYLEKSGAECIERLPWGSPVYRLECNGKHIQIAAYTEPSLFWERTQGVARSWNIMSDGKVLASLEDMKSEVAVI